MNQSLEMLSIVVNVVGSVKIVSSCMPLLFLNFIYKTFTFQLKVCIFQRLKNIQIEMKIESEIKSIWATSNGSRAINYESQIVTMLKIKGAKRLQ